MRMQVIAPSSWAANRLDILALGTDNAIWHDAWNGTDWSGAGSLGGAFDTPPAVTSWAANRLDIFALGTDNAIWHNAWEGTGWNGWGSLAGVFDSPPAAVSWAANRLDVFAVGNDSAMWHNAWDGTAWSGWGSLGGIFRSQPAVVSWAANRLDVFGLGIDNAMYHKAWDGTAWSAGWDDLGGVFTSPPAVASWAANRLDVFAIGLDNAMYHKAWDGTAWSAGWTDLGGVFASPPAVASWAANRLDVFGLGSDDAIWHNAWDGTAWNAWGSLGGVFESAPAVVSWAANRLDVFGVGSSDAALRHNAWDGTAWSGWGSLGGDLSAWTAAAPATGLGSNSNYLMASNCQPLTDVSVTIEITEEIVSSIGFGFQLNANSPQGEATSFQQYVMFVDSGELSGAVNNFNAVGASLPVEIAGLLSLPNSVLPAGYRLTIALENDASGNITGVTYVVVDNDGTTRANVTKQLLTWIPGLTTAELAPITAFQLNLVGPDNGQTTTLSSGAGTITYAASTRLTALNQEPVCIELGLVTAEMANSFYGVLPPSPSNLLTQSFNASAAQPMIQRPGTHSLKIDRQAG